MPAQTSVENPMFSKQNLNFYFLWRTNRHLRLVYDVRFWGRTIPALRGLEEIAAENDTAALTCNHFSHFKYSEIYHILRCFKISFFRQYSTHTGQFLYPEMKTPHRGVQGHTGASFIVDRSAHIFSLPITRKSGKHPLLLTSLPIRVYIPQAALPTSKNGGYVMDILQSFLSLSDPPKPTFSEMFHSAQELRDALGTKSYLLDHYLSLSLIHISEPTRPY